MKLHHEGYHNILGISHILLRRADIFIQDV